MKKIILFNAMPSEMGFIKGYAKKHQVQVTPVAKPLNMKTVSMVKGYDGVVTHTVSKDPKFYQELAQMGIKQIALRHTGYEIVNLKAATANHLVVTNVPAYSPRSVTEMVLAHVMYLLRHLGSIQNREIHGDFRWAGTEAREIHDLTVGVIGTGHIGSMVARVFHALGCNVIANDIKPTSSLEDTVKYVSKDYLFKHADIVTLHTPITKATTHMVGAKQFKEMKNSVIFINASRGAVVDTPALIKALDNHEIYGAGLDTVEDEIPVFQHDFHGKTIPNAYIRNLLPRQNVVFTPHVAFNTDNSIHNMVNISINSALAVINGQHPSTQVN